MFEIRYERTRYIHTRTQFSETGVQHYLEAFSDQVINAPWILFQTRYNVVSWEEYHHYACGLKLHCVHQLMCEPNQQSVEASVLSLKNQNGAQN